MEETPEAQRRGTQSNRSLSWEDVVDISYQVLIEKHTHQEVAKKYRVNRTRIASLMGRTQKNPN